MAIPCALGIYLNYLRADSHFYFLYCVEYKRAQAAVKAIEVEDVFEVYVFPSYMLFCIVLFVFELLGIGTEAIVTDIEKISGSLGFVVKNQPSLFETCHLFGQR